MSNLGRVDIEYISSVTGEDYKTIIGAQMLLRKVAISLPLFEELSIGGQKYFLAHTVPIKEKMLQMGVCRLWDFIMGEPEYEKAYFEDTIVITGHTPTGFIDPDYAGRIWKGNNHIAIDCGVVFGNPLGCICLDTMEEIYVD